MPRAPDKRVKEAYELYKQGIKLIDISKELDVPAGTVRRWKSTYKWDTERSDTKASVRKKKQNKKQVVAQEVEQVLNNPDLTDKQRLFCLHYSRCFNATKAYQTAFGCSYNVANAEGYKLLVKPCVKEEIHRLKQGKLNRAMLDESDIFQKYMDIAFADITDYLIFGQKQIEYIDKAGNERTANVSFVDLNDSDQVDGSIISEVSQGKEGVKVKLADRMKALQWLTDHMDLATEEQKARVAVLKAKSEVKEEKPIQITFVKAGEK